MAAEGRQQMGAGPWQEPIAGRAGPWGEMTCRGDPSPGSQRSKKSSVQLPLAAAALREARRARYCDPWTARATVPAVAAQPRGAWAVAVLRGPRAAGKAGHREGAEAVHRSWVAGAFHCSPWAGAEDPRNGSLSGLGNKENRRVGTAVVGL